MKREASAATFRSFWCLGNAHSIIKAARHVKLFVQFPEQQPNWELVMESRSFETASIYARQVFVFCLRGRLDGNLHYFYITVPPCLVLWGGTKKDGGICNAAYWSCSLVSPVSFLPVSGVACCDPLLPSTGVLVTISCSKVTLQWATPSPRRWLCQGVTWHMQSCALTLTKENVFSSS